MAYRRKTNGGLTTLPTECRWQLDSREDVYRFWFRVREAPRRMQRRTPKQYERYYLALYLLGLADHQLLSYPIEIAENESPDFIVTTKSAESTGLEVTRATDQDLQRSLTRAQKDHLNGGAFMPSPLGYAGDRLEDEWCNFVREAIEKKVAKFGDYSSASRCDLLISDDTRAGAGDRRKVLSRIDPWARDLKQKVSTLGKISVVASLDVLYDIGGESRIFPYLHWSTPKLDDETYKEVFSQRAELAGRLSVERAIREPSQRHIPSSEVPVPGYYVDIKGPIVKRTSEGRRFEVQIKKDGTEVVVRELPAG
jgi:hypothetical protein